MTSNLKKKRIGLFHDAPVLKNTYLQVYNLDQFLIQKPLKELFKYFPFYHSIINDLNEFLLFKKREREGVLMAHIILLYVEG